jgi:hypothetical protein
MRHGSVLKCRINRDFSSISNLYHDHGPRRSKFKPLETPFLTPIERFQALHPHLNAPKSLIKPVSRKYAKSDLPTMKKGILKRDQRKSQENEDSKVNDGSSKVTITGSTTKTEGVE